MGTEIGHLTLGFSLLGLCLWFGRRAFRPEGSALARRLRIERPREAKGRGFAWILTALAKGSESSGVSRQLVQAGFRSPSATRRLYAAKLVIAVGLPLAFIALIRAMPRPPPSPLPFAVMLCSLGFFLPNFWLRSHLKARRKTIERALPDALDLLVTCVEAGLGLDSALQRASRDMALATPMFARELELTSLEIAAGIARPAAFMRLYERTGVEELKRLAAVLAQAELFGTSVANSLREQASGMRTKRLFAAEERAAMSAVKMMIPLILFVLPSLLALIVGPAVISIMKVFTSH